MRLRLDLRPDSVKRFSAAGGGGFLGEKPASVIFFAGIAGNPVRRASDEYVLLYKKYVLFA
jgi:hypothetical protein